MNDYKFASYSNSIDKYMKGRHKMLTEYLHARKSPIDYFHVVFLLLLCWLIVYMTNGTITAFPYIFFIPIILASYRLGLIPAMIAAIIAGLLLGPFMYMDVTNKIPQTTTNWLVRMGFFTVIALILSIYTIQSKRLIFRDDLTHLRNRRFLDKYFPECLPKEGKGAVLFFNIDKFKTINDNLGYRFGDLLLKQFALRISQTLTNNDLFVRWGGDEIILILPNINNKHFVVKRIDEILSIVSENFIIEKREIGITVKVGVCLYPDDESNINDVINNADIALQFAKKHKEPFSFYNNEMKQTILYEMKVEEEIKRGLQNNEFFIHYQPKISVKDNTIIGAEALIRWKTSSDEMISPGEFIPIAEKTGLIVPLGMWIIREACIQNKLWQDDGLPPIIICVNVSSKQFAEKDFVEQIKNVLEETKLDPKYLELEITESVIMENDKTILNRLQQLKKLGIQLSLDDFGTGYSSLSYLKRFPIDTLKIDRSFIHHIVDNDIDKNVCEAIVKMGHALGLRIVAEGVESEQQYALLKEIQCDKIQGFLLVHLFRLINFLSCLTEKSSNR